tara:strand:+ start:1120 stop:1542 length:423 start_codon:yes stop_codon:yes gene_type:complete
MKSIFTKIFFFCLSVTLSLNVYSHGTIIIPNIEHDDGFIDVKIYDSKDSFLNEEEAIESVRKRVQKGEVVVPLSKIHEGKIAIVAYHDEDSDGKLKTGLFWRPKEGFAFSNNYQPKGPPSFEKAAIVLVHGEPVIIELNY